MIKPIGLHLVALAGGVGVGVVVLALTHGLSFPPAAKPQSEPLQAALSGLHGKRHHGSFGSPTNSRTVQISVPIHSDGGTFEVPVVINHSMALNFTVDSGAAYVQIPEDVALTLVRSGTITRTDYIGTKTFVLADGTTVPSEVFRIRSLKVGRLEMHDVTASITNTNGQLLLGQSFLSHLKSWSIDNHSRALLLTISTGQLIGGERGSAHTASDTPTSVLLTGAEIEQAAADFKDAFDTGGMSSVARYVGDCYSSIGAEQTPAMVRRATYCIAVDLAAQQVDLGFRENYQRHFGKQLPPTASFEGPSVRARVARYWPMLGASSRRPDARAFSQSVRAVLGRLAKVMDASGSGSG